MASLCFVTAFFLISVQVFGVLANSEVAENPEETSGYEEGDIVSVAPSLIQGITRSGMKDAKFRWPNSIVYYQFEPNYANASKKIFHQATEHISQRTCIKFAARTNQKDYIQVISNNAGCYSHVGRIGGKQEISLPTKCGIMGVHVHEIIHALGFHHEQSRTDRDDYVTINYNNIRDGMAHNFEKLKANLVSNYDVSYDTGSIMHYAATSFSKNKLPTIVPKQRGAKIGQRVAMSNGDITKLNNMYCKNTKTDQAPQQQLKLFK